MGGFFETDKMRKHVEQCAVCKIARLARGGTDYAACCDEYAKMSENVVDFESGEGAFEVKDGALMCDECDGPVTPGEICQRCAERQVRAARRHQTMIEVAVPEFPNDNFAWIAANWRAIVKTSGFGDAEIDIRREGAQILMRAWFADPSRAAAFAAYLTKLTGIVASLRIRPEER